MLNLYFQKKKEIMHDIKKKKKKIVGNVYNFFR